MEFSITAVRDPSENQNRKGKRPTTRPLRWKVFTAGSSR